jgi:hypothetical protein
MVDPIVLGLVQSVLVLVDVALSVHHYCRVFGSCLSSCGIGYSGPIRKDLEKDTLQERREH